MGWEMRRGRHYFYQSTRVDGEVRRRYLGTGQEAQRVAHEIAVRQQNRAANRLKLASLEAKLADANQLADRQQANNRLLRDAALLAHGFRRFSRQWRPVRRPAKSTF